MKQIRASTYNCEREIHDTKRRVAIIVKRQVYFQTLLIFKLLKQYSISIFLLPKHFIIIPKSSRNLIGSGEKRSNDYNSHCSGATLNSENHTFQILANFDFSANYISQQIFTHPFCYSAIPVQTEHKCAFCWPSSLFERIEPKEFNHCNPIYT